MTEWLLDWLSTHKTAIINQTIDYIFLLLKLDLGTSTMVS